MTDEIPDAIRNVIDGEEARYMRLRRGWATGTVVRVEEDDPEAERIEDAWIELFNGMAGAAVFGGVRFMAEVDGGLKEQYAYANEEAADEDVCEPYWYVEEYYEDDVDFGVPAP